MTHLKLQTTHSERMVIALAILEVFVGLIREEAIEHPGWGYMKIYWKLEEHAEKLGLQNAMPNKSTVSRQLKKFRDLPEKDQADFALFHWPQSMGRVPWDASKVALELVMALNEMGYRRPTIGLVNHYWHVKQALPSDVPLEEALQIAECLSRADQVDDPTPAYHYIESVLAYRAYETEGLALLFEAQDGLEQPTDKVRVEEGGKYVEFERKIRSNHGRRYEKLPSGGKLEGRMQPTRHRKSNQFQRDPSQIDETIFSFWIHFNKSLDELRFKLGIEEENHD